jgi:hypothetical protein
MNPITFAWKWLTNNLPDKQENYYTVLNEDERAKFKKVLIENETLKAQQGLSNSEKRAEQEKISEKDREQEVIKDLNEQALLINKNRFGDTMSLTKFFGEIAKNRAFKDSIEITDSDDKEIFGKFGDILVSNKDGSLILTDVYGNPISVGHRINDIIFKPETLFNQIRRKRILAPRDKDLNPIPDIANLEINDVSYDEPTKTWIDTQEFRDTIRNLLIKRDKIIRAKNEKIEILELTQIEQRKKMEDLQRSLNTYKSLKDTISSESSTASNLVLQTLGKNGEIQRTISQLTELKALNESQISTYKGIIEDLLEKLRSTGNKTLYEQAEEKVFSQAERFKNLLPERITEVIEPKTEVRVPNPGDSLGNKRA